MGNVFQSTSKKPQMAQRSHVLPLHEVKDNALGRLFEKDVYNAFLLSIPDRPPHSAGHRVPKDTSIQDLPSTPHISNSLPFHEIEDDELLALLDNYTHSTFLSRVYNQPKPSTGSRVLTNPTQGFPSTPSSSLFAASVSPSSPLIEGSTPGTSADIHTLDAGELFMALDQESLERDIRDAADLGHQILALEEKEGLDAVEKERAMKALFETWTVMYERVRESVDADCVKLDSQLACIGS